MATKTLSLKKTGKATARKSNPISSIITRKKRKQQPEVLSATSVTERHRLISEAAYLRAEKRGFQPGHEMEDWLEAEKDIDSSLAMTANTLPA